MNRNTSSIARKLNWSWTIKKFWDYIFWDILGAFLIIAAGCYLFEEYEFGGFVLNSQRSIISVTPDWYDGYADNVHLPRKEEFEHIHYLVINENGRFIASIGEPVFILTYVSAGIVFLQLFDILWTLIFGVFGIRRKLKPLDEIAKKAEELSSIAYDEGKYANLESAIDNVDPDGAELVVSTGNKDLEGVEIAINNLLTRMRESYRQQSRFVSDASHELRTPIAVIQGYANMLDRWGKEDKEVLEESIEAIKHESDNMKTLVEQLLFLARGDAGRNQLDMKEISLKAIIREVYEESRMIDNRHCYELYEDAGDVIMTGDFAMIKQSVRILVDNAAKYTKEGENIMLKSGINSELRPFFSIQDYGIGMNEEEVSHIFERFYRSDEARNRQTGGTGLGLAIAKWIIDKHNGYFDVISKPEIGTRFTVVFK